MSSKKPNNKATALKDIPKSPEGVKKRQYKKVRFLNNGLLDVERKTGKYFKIARQNQRESPLLKLPPEIRNLIFQYALGGVTYIIKTNYMDKVWNTVKAKHALALLPVCRQIYGETALLPFSLNVFSVDCSECLDQWTGDSLSMVQTSAITKIQLRRAVFLGSMTDRVTFCDFAQSFPKLPSLKHIEVTLAGSFPSMSVEMKKKYKSSYDIKQLSFVSGLRARNPGVHVTMEDLIA